MPPIVTAFRRFHPLFAAAAVLCSSAALATPASPAAPAQADSKKLPTGLEVVARHVEAIGGEEALRARTSRVIKGSVDNMLQNKIQAFEIFSAPPNKMIMKLDLGERMRRGGSDGETMWALDDFTGPQILPPPTPDTAPNFDFFRDLNYSKHYRIVETVSRERFEGRDCYKLRLVSSTGKETFEFFDAETGLRAGVLTVVPGRGKPPVTMIEAFSDWRDAGPLKSHFVITEKRNGELAQVFTYESVEYDTLAADFFDLPLEVKEHLAQLEDAAMQEQQEEQPQEENAPAPQD